MASTSINPAARRVLSPLNVNQTATPRSFDILKGGVAPSAESPRKMAQTSSSHEEKRTASFYPEVNLPKRGDYGMLDGARPQKKARTENVYVSRPEGVEDRDVKDLLETVSKLQSVLEGGIQHRKGRRGEGSLETDGSHHNCTRFPLPSASPASSLGGLDMNSVNDSQNTILTEPDDVPAGLSLPTPATLSIALPIVHRLTKEEAREKAEALKLRLRLASYRVFTNQITTPWKDLEARTMPLRKLNTSRPVRSNPLLSAELSSPVQSPVQEPLRNPDIGVIIPSSPPAYTATKPSSSPEVDSAMVSGHTQQLPRSIIPLSLSSSMSSQGDYNETSNAAKRSLATEGLLCLMQQQQQQES